MNSYNFSSRIRSALQSAREEAVRMRHEYVGTEHILLGIIADRGANLSVGQAILEGLALNFQEVKRTIEGKVKYGKTKVTDPDLPYTSRAKKVLELSMAEAREVNDNGVDTGHLLTALLAEDKGIAAEALKNYGVTLAQFREMRQRILANSQLAEIGQIPEQPTQPSLLRLVRTAFRGQHLDRHSRLTVVADLEALPPLVVAELLASLDMLHRAWGGAGLIIERQATGSCVAESVVSR